MQTGGYLHLATDWDDYACHMMKVLSNETRLVNLAGLNQYAERSINRPVLTKFECRAVNEGRAVKDLQFAKG